MEAGGRGLIICEEKLLVYLIGWHSFKAKFKFIYLVCAFMNMCVRVCVHACVCGCAFACASVSSSQ